MKKQDSKELRWEVVLRASLIVVVFLAVPYVGGIRVSSGGSMMGLGWLYRFAWGELPHQVVQIIIFAKPGLGAWRKYVWPSVKRVVKITDGGFVVEGDNAELSEDSRDWHKPVPVGNVAGTVVWIWSPWRAFRARDEWGKLINRLEFELPPSRIHLSPSGEWVVAEHFDGTLSVHGKGGYITTLMGFKGHWVTDQSFEFSQHKGPYRVRVVYNAYTRDSQIVSPIDRNDYRIADLGSYRLYIGGMSQETGEYSDEVINVYHNDIVITTSHDPRPIGIAFFPSPVSDCSAMTVVQVQGVVVAGGLAGDSCFQRGVFWLTLTDDGDLEVAKIGELPPGTGATTPTIEVRGERLLVYEEGEEWLYETDLPSS